MFSLYFGVEIRQWERLKEFVELMGTIEKTANATYCDMTEVTKSKTSDVVKRLTNELEELSPA
jgi:pheromone shutdown protein TraB